MKIKKKVTKKVEEVVNTVCDKCGQDICIESFDAFEFTLNHREGSIFPSGGSGIRMSLDLCKSCARGLTTLLKNEGYAVQEEEWDV